MSSTKWNILVWTLIWTPIPLALCLLFGGPYSSYFLSKLFYPYSMLIASKYGYITTIAVWIGILQFPAYGGLLILAENRLRYYKGFLILLVVHVLSFLIAIQYVEGFG